MACCVEQGYLHPLIKVDLSAYKQDQPVVVLVGTKQRSCPFLCAIYSGALFLSKSLQTETWLIARYQLWFCFPALLPCQTVHTGPALNAWAH